VARAHCVGHKVVDRKVGEFFGGIAEQFNRRGIAQHDAAAFIDQQQRIGICREQRAIDRVDVEPG